MSKSIDVRHVGPIAQLWLQRPQRHNALDEQVIHDAHKVFEKVAANSAVRVIVIAAEGPSFCAGADLEWMRRAAALGKEANFHDARSLAALLYAIATCPKPVIARVQGSAYGGGVGLIAACDIALSVPEAQFALTEVRVGLAAATISPYLLSAMGARRCRRLVLTGERFSANQAREYGLLHEVLPAPALDGEIQRLVEMLLAGGPHAQSIAKDVIREVEGEPLSPQLVEDTARRLAEVRASREGREGVSAFLEKRRPAWMAEG